MTSKAIISKELKWIEQSYSFDFSEYNQNEIKAITVFIKKKHTLNTCPPLSKIWKTWVYSTPQKQYYLNDLIGFEFSCDKTIFRASIVDKKIQDDATKWFFESNAVWCSFCSKLCKKVADIGYSNPRLTYVFNDNTTVQSTNKNIMSKRINENDIPECHDLTTMLSNSNKRTLDGNKKQQMTFDQETEINSPSAGIHISNVINIYDKPLQTNGETNQVKAYSEPTYSDHIIDKQPVKNNMNNQDCLNSMYIIYNLHPLNNEFTFSLNSDSEKLSINHFFYTINFDSVELCEVCYNVPLMFSSNKAHNIAKSKNGSNCPFNIHTICFFCNNKMDTENMLDYMCKTGNTISQITIILIKSLLKYLMEAEAISHEQVIKKSISIEDIMNYYKVKFQCESIGGKIKNGGSKNIDLEKQLKIYLEMLLFSSLENTIEMYTKQKNEIVRKYKTELDMITEKIEKVKNSQKKLGQSKL